MEKIFTLATGKDVPAQFDGLTVPYVEADSLQHALQLIGNEANLVAIFNQAYRLNVQKAVKAASQKKDATADTLRAVPAAYRPESIRVRDPNAEPKAASSGVIKEAKAAKQAAEDMFNVEGLDADERAVMERMREKYLAKMAAAGFAQTPAES